LVRELSKRKVTEAKGTGSEANNAVAEENGSVTEVEAYVLTSPECRPPLFQHVEKGWARLQSVDSNRSSSSGTLRMRNLPDSVTFAKLPSYWNFMPEPERIRSGPSARKAVTPPLEGKTVK